MSIQSPNYTQVPNALFEIMPDMDKSELKVVLAVCRMTVGWHKTKDRLTITRLMTLTGLSRQSVYDGIEKAKGRGILIQEETEQYGFVYSLDIQDEVSNEETPTHLTIRQEPIQPLDTQKKELNKDSSLSISEAVGDETPSPKQEALETLEKAFGKYGGSVNPRMVEELYKTIDANPDHPQERLQNALQRLSEKRNFFRAVDAYREWSLPKPPPVYSPRREQFARPTPPPYREKTPEEVAAFHAALAKGGP